MHIKISVTIKTVGCFFKWWRKVGRNLRLQLLFFVTFHVSIQLDQLLCVICWEINHSLSVVSRYITRAPRSWFDLLYNWSPNSDLLLNKSLLELICFLNITKKSSQNWNYITRDRKKQEAHGPRFAHLSDIATADMQMLCNIFPILSSQLMKISSFEQFLVLKKNIWAWQSMEHDHLNKLSITFQQKDQCEIWWKLAKWFLKNRDFIHVNSTVAGKYKYKSDGGHLRFPIRTILTTVDLQVTSILSI